MLENASTYTTKKADVAGRLKALKASWGLEKSVMSPLEMSYGAEGKRHSAGQRWMINVFIM